MDRFHRDVVQRGVEEWLGQAGVRAAEGAAVAMLTDAVVSKLRSTGRRARQSADSKGRSLCGVDDIPNEEEWEMPPKRCSTGQYDVKSVLRSRKGGIAPFPPPPVPWDAEPSEDAMNSHDRAVEEVVGLADLVGAVGTKRHHSVLDSAPDRGGRRRVKERDLEYKPVQVLSFGEDLALVPEASDPVGSIGLSVPGADDGVRDTLKPAPDAVGSKSRR